MLALCALPAMAATGKNQRRSTVKTQSAKASVRPRGSGATAKTSTRHTKASRTKGRKARKLARAPRGQRRIENDRAREIQEALIREKYLDGVPSGVWDQRTREALMRFQGDNGWQTKIVPDSRALIKLGLGPKHADVINPESVGLPSSARDLRPGGGPAQQ
ncbi:MAG: peptidoglycan-binding protein [Terriglobales bacterium]